MSLILKTPVIKETFRLCKVVEDAAQDIFGRHLMKLGAS
jgi:hypothetical protein